MNRIISPPAPPTGRPSRMPRLGVVALALVALLAIPAVGRAQVNDYATLFSPTAKQQALQAIEQMRVKHKHTMLIETYASVPPEKQAAADAAKTAGQRAQFFAQWIEERRRATGTTGIVLLISMDPGRVEMEVGDQTNKSGLFTSTDRDEMVPKIVDAMKGKRYDEVATIGTTSVLERMDRNVAANPAKRAAPAAGGAAAGGAASGGAASGGVPARKEAPSCGGLGMTSFVCIGIAVIGAIFLIRRMSAARNAANFGGPGPYNQGGGYNQPGYGQPGYGQPGYGQPQQGGGFGRGLMGGVLGGLGGAWLGNHLFGNSGSQAHGSTPSDPGAGGGAAGPDPYSAPDTGGTSSGMDFDSGGGGSDFGGGGGGDFGGGGGDSGGGDF